MHAGSAWQAAVHCASVSPACPDAYFVDEIVLE
jgi:hypothetical protein